MNTETGKGKLLIGWAAISTATPYRPDTLRKTYRVRMVDANVLFFRKVGRPPRNRPMGYANQIKDFFI